MFYIIGLGLCDEKDITLRGLEAVKKCTRIYLEAYTSILMVQKERLVSFSSVMYCNRAGLTMSIGRAIWKRYYSRRQRYG